MKKRSTVLIILMIILAVIIAAYFMILRTNETNAPPPMTIETSPIMIAEDDPATIRELEYSYNGETLAFEFSEIAYKWYYKSDNKFPLEQTYLQTMASVISSMAVNRVVEETRDNFTQYGLDEPFLTVSATFIPEKEAGYKRVYHVGGFNSFNNSYYFNIEGTDIVYAIASTFTPYFSYNLVDLAVNDVIPLFSTVSINMKSCDANGNIINNEAKLNEIAASFSKLTLGKPVAYDNIETSVEVTIEYTETVSVSNEDGSISTNLPVDHTFICRFGDSADDGMTYFTVNESGLIYLINTDTANAILDSILKE